MVDQSSQSKVCLSSKQWTMCARWHDDTWVMIVVRGKNSSGNKTDPNRTSTKGLNQTQDSKTSLYGEPQPSSHWSTWTSCAFHHILALIYFWFFKHIGETVPSLKSPWRWLSRAEAPVPSDSVSPHWSSFKSYTNVTWDYKPTLVKHERLWHGFSLPHLGTKSYTVRQK